MIAAISRHGKLQMNKDVNVIYNQIKKNKLKIFIYERKFTCVQIEFHEAYNNGHKTLTS